MEILTDNSEHDAGYIAHFSVLNYKSEKWEKNYEKMDTSDWTKITFTHIQAPPPPSSSSSEVKNLIEKNADKTTSLLSHLQYVILGWSPILSN